MDTFSTMVDVVFVLSLLAATGYPLLAMSPFARHTDQFRDPQTGRRLGESARLTQGWREE